jgi:drug/metabolite transporter (DMT)-like permease
MTHHNLSPRQYMILGLVALCAPLGDSCLSRGMTTLPAISLAHPGTLIAAVFTPWIALGIALLIGFFASYLTALSWADLTFVLPATAFGNVIVAFFARFWLHEAISLERWAGIALITIGVGFVAQGPSLTERPVKQIPASNDHDLGDLAEDSNRIAASVSANGVPRATSIQQEQSR